LPRLLRGLRSDGQALSWDEHTSVHGRLPRTKHDGGGDPHLIEAVRRAGVVGRGGASFPTGRKLAAVAAAASPRRRPLVVINGAEGEPVSSKDRVLLRRTPHLTLDGAQVCARAVGATEVVVATTTSAAAAVSAAISERDQRNADGVPTVVSVVPERFVAGQYSALVNFLEGGPGLPTFGGPGPHERGVAGRPTLILNTETVAHIALVARHGPEWFRQLGTAAEPGSTLTTAVGSLRRPGVYEVPRGLPLSGLVGRCGGPTAPLQAYLVGGYAGTWIPADEAWDCPLSEDGLRPAGGTLGVGVVMAFPSSACGLRETARILRYLAGESAGQCGPCVHGLPALADGFAQLAAGNAQNDIVRRLENWAWQVNGRGACRHPDGAARLALSALRVFAADAATHAHHRPCVHRSPLGARITPTAPR